MQPMKPHFLGSLVLLALLATGCATRFENRRWVAIETEHFQFLTDDDEAKSVQLAREFELFHSFMEQMTGGKKLQPNVPTVVYLFSSQATYRAFAPSNTAGYYRGTARANYIAVGKGLDFSETEVAFHEYSHYMMRSRGLFGYPMWYDEGQAEFVGTARVRDGRFELGRAPKVRVQTLAQLGPMPLKRMLTAKSVSSWSDAEIAQLYATGWFFVHYLYTSAREGTENRWLQKDDFLARLNQGQDPEEAFKASFGTDFKKIERELANYLKRLSALQIPVERFGSVAEPKVRPVEGPEALTRLAELLVAGGDSRRAVDLLEQALALDERQPRALALLGRALGDLERHEEAEARFAQALRQEPDSALAHIDYGLYLASRSIRRNRETFAVEPTDLPAEQRAAYLKRARIEYERAIALDSKIPEAHTELAFTYLAPGEPAEQAIVHADEAFALLPSDNTTALQLAEVLVAAGRFDEARPVLTRLLPDATRSKTYREYLDGLLARVAQADAAAR